MSLMTFKLVFTLTALALTAGAASVLNIPTADMFAAMAFVIAARLWAENLFIAALLNDPEHLENLLKEKTDDTTRKP